MDTFFIPDTLGVCDFNFETRIPIQHAYTNPSGTLEPHDFRIEIFYKPEQIAVINSGVLTSVTNEPSYPNSPNWVLKGIVTVQNPLYGDPSIGIAQEMVTILFERVQGWHTPTTNPSNNITILVFDLNCDGQEVMISQIPSLLVSYPEVFDTRKFTSNKVSELSQLPNNPLVTDCFLSPSIIVDDEFIIDQFFCNFGNPNLRQKIVLLPGAKVIVESYLALSYVDIGGCPDQDQVGHGIFVNSNKVLALQNCTITDCYIGVEAKNNATFQAFFNNSFVNNYTGLKLFMDEDPFNKNIEFLNFGGNTFYRKGTLKPVYSGIAPISSNSKGVGISAKNYNDLNIFGWAQSGAIALNRFSNLGTGIEAIQTTGNFENMEFENTDVGIYMVQASQMPVWVNINSPGRTMTFRNCGTGVYTSGYWGSVREVNMEDVNVGIHWNKGNLGDVLIQDNIIEAIHTGIMATFNEPFISGEKGKMRHNTITITGQGSISNPPVGIRVLQAGQTNGLNSGWNILESEISMKNGGFGLQYDRGKEGRISENQVYAEGSNEDFKGIVSQGAEMSAITYNSIGQDPQDVGFSYGIYSNAGNANRVAHNCTDYISRGLEFLDMANLTGNVAFNHFQNYTHGLEMEVNAVIGAQYHMENYWDLGSSTDALHKGGPPAAGLSRFRVDQNDCTNYMPKANPSEWFQNNSNSGTAQNCDPGALGCNFYNPDEHQEFEAEIPDELDYSSLYGTLPVNLFETEMRWKAAYRLARKLMRHPSIAAVYPEFAAFSLAHEASALGQLAYIGEQRSRLFDISESGRATAATLLQTFQQQNTSLADLERLRHAGDSIDQPAFQSALDLRNGALADLTGLLYNQKLARDSQVQQLRVLNQGVAAVLPIEANHKTVNDIFLRYILADSFSTADILVLDQIARQCPWEGGDAVLEARTVISEQTGEFFDQADYCPALEDREAAAAPAGAAFQFFPNPSTGFISWNSNAITAVKVFDTLGKLQLEKSGTLINLDLSGLNNGIYFLNFSFEDGTQTRKSVLIQH